MGLRTVGERVRKDVGRPVEPPRTIRERRFVRHVQHLLTWWPRTSREITLATLGCWKHEWDEESQCYTCQGKGFIDGDYPFHLKEWARTRGAKCLECGGIGRVIRQYEERNAFPRSFVRRTQLLFYDVDGVVHMTTKKGKVRRSRCGTFKELPETLLSAYGRCTCMACLAWRP